jgi:hypothetical protein
MNSKIGIQVSGSGDDNAVAVIAGNATVNTQWMGKMLRTI